MPYPWANVILLFLLAAELATGLFGLVSGSSDRAIYLHLHRILGFSILAVFLWKSRNIFRSLSRIRRLRSRKTTSAPIPYASLAIVLLLALSVGLALAWSHTGPFKFQGFSGVSWHIYVSVPLAPLLLGHALSKRWTLRPVFWAQRRNFLRTGGTCSSPVSPYGRSSNSPPSASNSPAASAALPAPTPPPVSPATASRPHRG